MKKSLHCETGMSVFINPDQLSLFARDRGLEGKSACVGKGASGRALLPGTSGV